MPKVFHVKPKVGEGVLVIINEEGNKFSDMFYLGPIISKEQYIYKDEYNYGRGTSGSMLKGKSVGPLVKLSMYDSTRGSFPSDEDVALVGRKGEDVILKEDEIDIRCGIRGQVVGSDDPNLQGYVLYNVTDPAYIQLKRKNNLCTKKYGSNDRGTNAVVNVVADKINLLSYSDPNQFNLTDNAHPATYADELIDLLNIMRDCVLSHLHPYPGLSCCNTSNIQTLAQYDMEQIKSNFVRIS